ncbi:MAG: hypothetical protein AB1938_24970 [Myxococcota bacterium]
MTALAVLCAAPAWATSLLIVPRTEAARPTCESLVEVFSAQKMTVKMAGPKSAAASCLGKPAGERPACFLDAQAKSRVDGIVLISATKKGQQVAVTMELLSKVTGKVNATEKVKAPVKALKAKANTPVQRLVVEMLVEDGPSKGGAPVVGAEAGDEEELAPLPTMKGPTPPPEEPKVAVVLPVEPPPEVKAEVKPPEPPKPVTDVPKAAALVPAVKDTPVLVAPGPAKGPNVPAIVLTGAAVAAATAAALFGGMALSSKAQLESAPGGISPLSYEQALALQNSANTNFTIALGAGVGAGVCAGVATYLWATK